MERADLRGYRYRDRQIGRSRWRRIDATALPPPRCEERVSMQRFAAARPVRGEVHVVDLTLDFDAHADWLDVEHARREALALLAHLERVYALPPEAVGIAYTGGAGFHLALPAPLLGGWASAEATAAAKALATAWRADMRLVTLDAPTGVRQATADDRRVWRQALADATGHVPPPLDDDAALDRWLARSGRSFFTRRRLIRRLNAPRADGGWKIPLTPDELADGMERIRALAAAGPRAAAGPCPVVCPALADAYATALAAAEAAAAAAAARPLPSPRPPRHPPEAGGAAAGDGEAALRAAIGGDLPVCAARLARRPPPPGGSNPEIMALASMLRELGVAEADAAAALQRWAGAWRAESVASVTRAVYAHGYAFGYPFMRTLGAATRADCADCPFRAQFTRCWGTRRGRP
jgi:hypothetical protein